VAKVRKPLQKDQLNSNPVHKEYASSALMIADQANQTGGYLYYNGQTYWEYLGTTVGDITDYRPFFGSFTEINTSDLRDLKDNSNLVAGQWYKILDFETIHLIPNTTDINTGPVEPLYIQAISNNQFGTRVYSDTYVNDIIEFDFNNVLCEDGTTPRKGKIEFRHNIQSDTYTYYDWRHAKFRRWKITGKVTETVVKLTDTSFESNFVHFDISNTGMAQGSERFFIKFESGITHDAGSITLTIKKSSPTRSYTKPLLKWDGTSWNANELSGTEGIIVVCRLRNAFIYFNGRNYGNELIGTYASPYSFNFSLNPTIYYLVDSDDYVDYLTFNGQYKGVHFENSLQPEFGNVFYGNNTVFLSSVLYTTFVNRNDGNTFFEYTSDLTVAGNLTYCIFFKDIYNTVINDAQFSTFYTVLYILNVQNRIDASILYLHPFSSCELGEIEYSFIETFSSSNLGRSFVLNGKISFSFLSVGGVSTQSNFPIIPNGTQTSSVNVSKLTTFTFNGSAFRSLIGWFNSEGITLSRVYNFESVWEVEKLQNVVDKLKIDNLVSPVGDVNLLGRDEQGNVVDATAALGGLVGAGAGLSIDGNGDIQLGDADSVVFSPRTDVSNFDAAFLIRGKSEFSYKELGFSIDSYQLIGQNNLDMVGPNGALYRFNEVLDGSADFNRQVTTTDNLLQNSVFFRQFVSSGHSRFELSASRGFVKQSIEFGLNNGTWGAVLTDSATEKGFVYAADYFTNGSLDDRWIPDWGAVKGYVGGQGFLTSFTETDPTVAAHIKAITSTQITNWDTAFGWGDHSVAGYVTLTTAQTITGLKTIRRAGASDGSSPAQVLGFEIGNDDLYKMWVMNSQNVRSTSGEVNWFFRMRELYGTGASETPYNHDRIGFHRGGITVIGDSLPSTAISTELETWVNANFATGNPYAISTYIHRDIMVSGRGYFGKSNLDNTLFLDADDQLFSGGTVYGAKGLRTADPNNKTTIFNHTTWFLGAATADATGSHTHKLRVDIDGTLYDIYAQSV
jgi:hypothetical protein